MENRNFRYLRLRHSYLNIWLFDDYKFYFIDFCVLITWQKIFFLQLLVGTGACYVYKLVKNEAELCKLQKLEFAESSVLVWRSSKERWKFSAIRRNQNNWNENKTIDPRWHFNGTSFNITSNSVTPSWEA